MGNNLMQADLSVWGMYHHADIVVKVVMIGLILASVVTWAIFFGKGAEILASKRRLKREQQQLAEARSLDQASDIASAFEAKSLTTQLINEAQNELELSAGAEDNEASRKEPVSALNAASRPSVAIWGAATATWPPSAPFRRSWACSGPSGAS